MPAVFPGERKNARTGFRTVQASWSDQIAFHLRQGLKNCKQILHNTSLRIVLAGRWQCGFRSLHLSFGLRIHGTLHTPEYIIPYGPGNYKGTEHHSPDCRADQQWKQQLSPVMCR